MCLLNENPGSGTVIGRLRTQLSSLTTATACRPRSVASHPVIPWDAIDSLDQAAFLRRGYRWRNVAGPASELDLLLGLNAYGGICVVYR